MSGPKRGRLYFDYDPTPTRLADLERFSCRLDSWLAKNAQFLSRHLGGKAVAEARRARQDVQEWLEEGDPDEGFDAYGAAWATFNRLWSDAAGARDRARALRAQKRRERERKRRLALSRTRSKAAHAVARCRTLWEDPESQALLARWASDQKRRALEVSLESMGSAKPGQVPRLAPAWEEQFGQLLGSARKAAQGNAQRLAELLPVAHTDLGELAGLNLRVLPEDERQNIAEERARLAEVMDEVISQEDSQAVERVHLSIDAFLSSARATVREAQIRFASEKWSEALGKLGYAVKAQQGEDGALVLEAKAFPTRKVRVELEAGSDQVSLHVDPEHDTRQCHQDVRSLQKILAEAGIRMEMTDWGRANPGSALQLTNQARQEVRVRL